MRHQSFKIYMLILCLGLFVTSNTTLAQEKNKKEYDIAAVVLDGQNCNWSKACIGLPSVVQVGNRLAFFYDAPSGNSINHMKRHVGLAWLELPLSVPK